MKITYNLTNRKPFVKALEEITGAKSKYLFTPTYAFEVDYFTVTREGNLTCNDNADPDAVEAVLTALADRGYNYESFEYDEPQPEEPAQAACEASEPEAKEIPEAATDGGQADDVGLTVTVPLDKVSLGNLINLLDAKANLIEKALGITGTPIEVDEEGGTVHFHWFDKLPDSDAVLAYTHFITALCKMSKEQKRISSTEKPVENEKYAFRCFLLRLGFIGSDYKTERKILLQNLSGSSAFKSGAKKQTESEVASDEISE